MVNFDAVIFDLDGVITQTALVHGSAWKKMFDEYLRYRERLYGEPFREFTHADDYLLFVDGKPRYKGVSSFLESRGIELPYGDPSDPPESETVCGLGNRKNKFFNEVLDTEGVKVYDTSVELIAKLKDLGIRIGVASSSKNCKPVLEATGLLHLFETRIDGVVSAEQGLKGKPEPDIFTTACDELGVPYHRSVVVEDAVSGVQAGFRGNFGFVLGIARENNVRDLYANGADRVVTDLGEISIEEINQWFVAGLEKAKWSLTYHDYNMPRERSREALLAVGNGLFATRGAMEESRANHVNYPGTYVAGLYNRLISEVGGREIENEDFVNVPNWLPMQFRIDDGEWFGFSPDPSLSIEQIKRHLDFRTGELIRELLVSDSEGRKTWIRSSRFASMNDPHKAGIRYTIKPVNYSGRISLAAELNGDHINAGVERYKQLYQKHLVPVEQFSEKSNSFLVVKTTQSNITIAEGAKYALQVPDGVKIAEPLTETGEGWIRSVFSFDAEKEQEVTLEKLVVLFTSAQGEVRDPLGEARSLLVSYNGYEDEFKKSTEAWEAIWEEADIVVEGDRYAQKIIRLHLYHTLITASPHHVHLDAGIPPRGLHGEAYRGHIFWDELYILPIYTIHFPEIVRSVLMYRYRRLDKARENAREHGYKGAMFPWQSGSDGREETQIIHLNPVSGEWGDDYSSLQRHVSLAIAYNIWNFYFTTGDKKFMVRYGAEMFLEICRFWASKSEWDDRDQKFHIDRVMGPDEFHEKYPDAAHGGLKDNAYTNLMVSWSLHKAFRIIEQLSPDERQVVLNAIGLTNSEIIQWKNIAENLALEISPDGIIEQFNGYFTLKELDWEKYQKQYGDIHRMDRILKAENQSPDDFKVSKQADLLMIFYNLDEQEVTGLIETLGYAVPEDYLKRNLDYYLARTSHGSTLSRLVHSHLAWETGNHATGWKLFMDALQSDLVDIQGGTTGEGIHCGVMAGTVYSVLKTFCGIDLRGEIPGICPDLPASWNGVKFSFRHKGTKYLLDLVRDRIEISALKDGDEIVSIHLCGEKYELQNNQKLVIRLKT